jgi:hypothetical protein
MSSIEDEPRCKCASKCSFGRPFFLGGRTASSAPKIGAPLLSLHGSGQALEAEDAPQHPVVGKGPSAFCTNGGGLMLDSGPIDQYCNKVGVTRLHCHRVLIAI